jgi:hypothetical protein
MAIRDRVLAALVALGVRVGAGGNVLDDDD